jgi:demethylphylloquinone reductase
MTQPRICIVGGGFGGLYTALRLNELPWENNQKPEITLIDKSDRFLFSPLLYELITEELQTWEIAPPFEEILANTGIIFRQGSVTKIDLEQKEITVNDDLTLKCDRLVLATGNKTPLDLVPGVKESAIPFRNLDDAYRLKEKLRLLSESDKDKIRVAIVGGGYSGVELACKISDLLGNRGRIRIIDRGNQILDHATEYNRQTAVKALEQRQIWLDLETETTEVTPDTISLRYKGQIDTIPVDLIAWTVGNQVSSLTKNLNLAKNSQELLKIKPTLQLLERDDIYALGDIAECLDESSNLLPATAQVAFQQSDYCAWNIWADLNQKPLLSFRYQPLGEMMTLGKDSAVLTGLGLKLEGIPAYIARRLIYLYRLPTLKHQLTVGLNWLTQPLVELLSSS